MSASGARLDVMCYEVFAEEAEALRRYLPSHITSEFTPHTIQAAGHAAPPASLITVRTQSVIPSSWTARLAGILTRSSGYDHLLGVRAQSQGTLPCGYLPRYCARAVAEQAILLQLALARKLTRQLQQFATFHRDGLTGTECQQRTAVVIGVGHIGQEIVRLAQGLGMHVYGVDLVQRMPGLTYVSLEEGLLQADVIFCALPLTEDTRGWLNYARLRRAKAGALFINIARGDIAPTRELRRLLDEGILGGIGLDVYEEEPVVAEALRARRDLTTAAGRALLALRGDERVLCTPHNAFNTREALERKAQQSSESIAAFLTTGVFPYPIPTPST